MKKSFIIILIAMTSVLSACDSFLDQQPIDKQTTAKDIFSKKASTDEYLHRVYSFVPRYWTISAEEAWGPLSDESEVSFNHDVHNVHKGAFGPSAAYYKKWGSCYKGIREATYFLQNVHMCKELSQEEMDQYIAEARFLRAYYYFLLIRNYGPVVLMGDQLLDPESDGNIGRSPLEKCVEYASNELWEASKVLVPVQPQNYLGKPTSGAALALRSRLLLYAASPLFNSDNSIYSNWKSKTTGENLMPTSYSKKKWEDAAAAALEVINLPQYKLMEVKKTGSDEIDPYASLYKVYTSQWNNEEVIFGRIFSDEAWYKRITPRAMNGCWGGYNPTQKQVDAFAMNSGVYPIRGYSDAKATNGDGKQPIIDAVSGYSEKGVTQNFEHPFDKIKYDTYNMYVDREPRFYINITWDGMKLPYAVSGTGEVNKSQVIQFYFNGNSGGPSGDRSVTGYTVRKMYNNANDPAQSIWMKPMVWPMIRLAEIYLNYTEALIESNYKDPSVLTYWNKVRARAGVPNIEEVYPGIENDQTLMREMIRRERQVELAFENQRYFDTRRWMIAEETNNGPVYGMDISQTTDQPLGTAAFWKRTASKDYEPRVFPKAYYLHPVEQWEMDRNTMLEPTPLY